MVRMHMARLSMEKQIKMHSQTDTQSARTITSMGGQGKRGSAC